MATEETPTPSAPDVRLLHSIMVRNLLSFGPETGPLELRALNVLIGPNGSGKSNLLDCVELLKFASQLDNFAAYPANRDYYWKGIAEGQLADISVEVGTPRTEEPTILTHTIAFSNDWMGPELLESIVFNATADRPARTYFETTSDGAKFYQFGEEEPIQLSAFLGDYDRKNSVLQQVRMPGAYPTIKITAFQYAGIRFYREWTFGRKAQPRQLRPADERNDFLAEDASNLGLVLNKLRRYPEVKAAIINQLGNLYAGAHDFDVLVEGGSVQIFIDEGPYSIPATRLSDGTLRFLCLLVILLHPNPPRLICIEEPELGLHPDAVIAIGRLLKEASERTQLIVTTHSDIILDCVSPDDVIVCEKHDGQTEMNRLSKEELKHWLEKYSLSQLWTRNHIGGNRW